MGNKNLRIRVALDVAHKKALSGLNTGLRSVRNLVRGSFTAAFRNLRNLIRSTFAALFRTAGVAGFFYLFRKGTQTIQNLKSTVLDLGKQFAQLRLKAAETAGIITGGGEEFTSVFQKAVTMSRVLSNQIGTSAIDIQEGLVTAARSGLGLSDSLSVTQSAMALAVSNGMEFQGTLNDLIASTRAFGVELDQVPHFADALTQAVRTSLTSLQGLFAGLKRVGAIASTAFGEGKQTFLDTAAALMTLNDAGVQGEIAGTRLRSFMTKLVAQTSKVSAAFAKYGVNIFEANGASQKYLGTLMRGSRAMQSTKDRLNSLKDQQFKMVLANKEGTKEYEQLGESIDLTSQKLQNLESGTDKVLKEFQLSGGKLKDFSKLLNDLAKNVPSEVLAKAFGIRGGQAGNVLINNIDKFNKFKKVLEEVSKASEEGQSVLGDIFGKFLKTFIIKWMKMKNTVINIFGEMADSAFDAFAPIFDPIQRGLEAIFYTVSANKGSFKEVFEGVAEKLQPVADFLEELLTSFTQSLHDIFKGTDKDKVDVIGLKREDGKLTTTTTELSGTKGEKFLGLIKVLGDSFVAAISYGLSSVEEQFKYLAELFATYFTTAIQARIAIFESIGVKLGAALAVGLINAIKGKIREIKAQVSSAMTANAGAGSAAVGGVSYQQVKEQVLDTPAGKIMRKVGQATMSPVANVLESAMGAMDVFEAVGYLKTLQKNALESAKHWSAGMKDNAEASTKAKNLSTTASRNAHQEKVKLR